MFKFLPLAAKFPGAPCRSIILSLPFVRSFSSSVRVNMQKTVDRPLPDVLKNKRQNRTYFLVFCGVMVVSLFGMVKYEAANSPIVTSTLQALRRSPLCLANIGSNIRFASAMPWVSGNTGIAKDVVDFNYEVCGELGGATVRFRAVKVPNELRYTMQNWSIRPHQGPNKDHEISLLEEEYVPHVPSSNTEEPTVVRNLKSIYNE